MENSALMTGFMVAASAFITVAGIILATGGRERLGVKTSASLVLSLGFGTALIITALNSFVEPPDSMQLFWIIVGLQIFTFYIPMWKLVSYRRSIPEGENMLSKEEEKDINIKMDTLADEYMKTYIPDAKVEQFENLAIAFTYKQSVKLVKSTDKLKSWTIAIVVLTIVMICTTIANIVIVVTQ